MDWTQVFVILGVFGGSFLYLAIKVDGIRKDVHNVDQRLTRIEARLEFSSKVVYVQHEEMKEN